MGWEEVIILRDDTRIHDTRASLHVGPVMLKHLPPLTIYVHSSGRVSQFISLPTDFDPRRRL